MKEVFDLAAAARVTGALDLSTRMQLRLMRMVRESDTATELITLGAVTDALREETEAITSAVKDSEVPPS